MAIGNQGTLSPRSVSDPLPLLVAPVGYVRHIFGACSSAGLPQVSLPAFVFVNVFFLGGGGGG